MADDAQYYEKMQQNKGWQQILASFARFVDARPNQRVLDVGCGPAAFVVIMKSVYQTQVSGVDMDIEGCRIAQKLYHDAVAGILAVGTLPTLPYADNTFDIITAANVIYLIDDPWAAIREIVRILKPKGHFSMLNPSVQMSQVAATELANVRRMEGFAHENFIHWGELAEQKMRFSEAVIREEFAKIGLNLVATQSRIGDGLALYAKGQKQ